MTTQTPAAVPGGLEARVARLEAQLTTSPGSGARLAEGVNQLGLKVNELLAKHADRVCQPIDPLSEAEPGGEPGTAAEPNRQHLCMINRTASFQDDGRGFDRREAAQAAPCPHVRVDRPRVGPFRLTEPEPVMRAYDRRDALSPNNPLPNSIDWVAVQRILGIRIVGAPPLPEGEVVEPALLGQRDPDLLRAPGQEVDSDRKLSHVRVGMGLEWDGALGRCCAVPDSLGDHLGATLHDDSSAQGRPESVLRITVEVSSLGCGDSRPCGCGGAK